MKAINKIGLFVFLTSFGVSLMGQEAITDTTNKTTSSKLARSSVKFQPTSTILSPESESSSGLLRT